MSDVAEHVEQSAEQLFATALAAFQAELPRIATDRTARVTTNSGPGYQYDYADLTDVTAKVVPLLAKHGLSWTASPTLTDSGAFVLRYALLHEAGHRECGLYPLPDPARSSPQQIGSALTYARRYALTSITGVAPGGDDDDGQSATEARSVERPARQQPQSQPAQRLVSTVPPVQRNPVLEVIVDSVQHPVYQQYATLFQKASALGIKDIPIVEVGNMTVGQVNEMGRTLQARVAAAKQQKQTAAI